MLDARSETSSFENESSEKLLVLLGEGTGGDSPFERVFCSSTISLDANASFRLDDALGVEPFDDILRVKNGRACG